MKIILCCVDNIDSNISSCSTYVKVKSGRAYTEQTIRRFSEKNIQISSALIPKVKCIQNIIHLFLNRVGVFGRFRFWITIEALDWGRISPRHFSVHEESHEALSVFRSVSSSVRPLATALCFTPCIALCGELPHNLVILRSHPQCQLFIKCIPNVRLKSKTFPPSDSCLLLCSCGINWELKMNFKLAGRTKDGQVYHQLS